MFDTATCEEIVSLLVKMPNEQQKVVLEFVRSLVKTSAVGTSGKSLLRFAGAVNPEDLKIIEQAINEECEKIDNSNW